LPINVDIDWQTVLITIIEGRACMKDKKKKRPVNKHICELKDIINKYNDKSCLLDNLKIYVEYLKSIDIKIHWGLIIDQIFQAQEYYHDNERNIYNTICPELEDDVIKYILSESDCINRDNIIGFLKTIVRFVENCRWGNDNSLIYYVLDNYKKLL
jgi:hypothetical protein